ncbi:MAG: Ig-like domain-containing protein [Desulfuromonadaceae bacterium]|nr:Ig-like domain-containing protein [Desulfuromonadaceae bacterium]
MKKMQMILIILFLLTFLVPATAEQDLLPPTLTVNVLPNDDGTVKVYGTAIDPSGIDRVEIKLNENSWRTAEMSGNEFTYTEEIKTTGTHVVLIRAFDTVGNPTPTEIKTFYAQKKQTSSSDDLSFFVRVSSLKVTTFNSSMNLREMAYPQDFCVEFSINNDDTVPHKIRYRIDVNGEELTEDVNIKKDGSYSVSEWYPASILSEGQNRIKITIIDWETREIIEDKNLTLNLLSAIVPAKNLTESYPVWLEEFASANGLTIPATVESVEKNNTKLENEISQLRTEIERLKTVNNTPEPEPEKTIFEKYWVYGVFGILLLFVLYLHKIGKLDDFIKSDKPKEEEKKPLLEKN